MMSSSHLRRFLLAAPERRVCAFIHPTVLVLIRCCSARLIQAVLAIAAVTLIKFNYAQASSCVEKNS